MPETRFERIHRTVGGVAVDICTRVAAEAGPGEALVSSTVQDLVSGSGIPGTWRLFAVEQAR